MHPALIASTIFAFLLAGILIGPILAPGVGLLLLLGAALIVTARADVAYGTSRWKVFGRLASIAVVSIVTLDVLFVAVALLGGVLGLWPAIGSGE
jgi:hypothetical protein